MYSDDLYSDVKTLEEIEKEIVDFYEDDKVYMVFYKDESNDLDNDDSKFVVVHPYKLTNGKPIPPLYLNSLEKDKGWYLSDMNFMSESFSNLDNIEDELFKSNSKAWFDVDTEQLRTFYNGPEDIEKFCRLIKILFESSGMRNMVKKHRKVFHASDEEE
jgi:hypothetical protein